MKNTANIARSDIHKTKFIEVPKIDIINIINYTIAGSTTLGFKSNDPQYILHPLKGTYPSTGAVQYFYKGYGTAADVFMYLRQKNIV